VICMTLSNIFEVLYSQSGLLVISLMIVAPRYASNVQLGDGINRPQDRQYDAPDTGDGGASFFPPLLLLELIS
jgi:hypothetical protein